MAISQLQEAYQDQTSAPLRQTDGAPEFECRVHPFPDRTLLQSLWNALPGGVSSTPFQTIGFLDAFQRCMLASSGERFELHEFCRAETGETVLLLPVHIQRRGPLKVASLPDLGLADQGGPVLARGTDLTDAETEALWRAFTGSLTNVDVITFKNIVPVLGPQLNPLYRLACAETDQTMLMLIMAEEGEQEVWRRRPVFKEVRQKNRKLTAEGVTFSEARTPEERLEILAFIREQRRLRFQAMGRTNSLEFPGRIGFYQDIAAFEGGNRNAAFLALRTETEIVAAIMAFVTRDMINGVLIGMGDEKWHRMSPGVVLFAQTIEWAKTNRFKQFSFGTGMQGYKQRFGPEEVPLKRIYLPLTPLGRAVLKLRHLRQTIRNLWHPGRES